jgi:hypothetical protein
VSLAEPVITSVKVEGRSKSEVARATMNAEPGGAPANALRRRRGFGARPRRDQARLPVAAAELDTVRRLALPMVIVVHNDDAYGAEVHYLTDGSRSERSPSPIPTSRLSGAGTVSRRSPCGPSTTSPMSARG